MYHGVARVGSSAAHTNINLRSITIALLLLLTRTHHVLHTLIPSITLFKHLSSASPSSSCGDSASPLLLCVSALRREGTQQRNGLLLDGRGVNKAFFVKEGAKR